MRTSFTGTVAPNVVATMPVANTNSAVKIVRSLSRKGER